LGTVDAGLGFVGLLQQVCCWLCHAVTCYGLKTHALCFGASVCHGFMCCTVVCCAVSCCAARRLVCLVAYSCGMSVLGPAPSARAAPAGGTQAMDSWTHRWASTDRCAHECSGTVFVKS
jgi:hypothetical protein